MTLACYGLTLAIGVKIMAAARHTSHRQRRADRPATHARGASRFALRHTTSMSQLVRRRQGGGVRVASVTCRILVRARFDLDAVL
jgi:hypothetical protein